MKKDDMILKPTVTGSVRVLKEIDIEKLKNSLKIYIDKASEIRQQGLRWAGDFEGVSDLRYKDANPKQIGEKEFKNWQPNTEVLQEIAKELGIRDMGRVRVLMIPPKTTYSFHYDMDAWRVHIPLITNSDAFMVVDGKLWHLEIGYAYLVKVAHYHLALNAGNENRIHIVFDWCDNLA